ncbi:hypothetical protein Tco_1003267 [Tanacetum coccineum]|uniref:Uncharacterized protein n=1 Tax=Tanacetum coccineum TaxID=301880 RepID=A0ABQ5F9Q5_9ASTR
MMILFLIRLNGYYYEEKKGSYGPQFSKAYSEASQSIPRKEKDLGSFTLPYFINNVCFDNSFVDLGASVNVMPLLTYLNLGLGELAHTKLTVELAVRTMKYPKGIAENVLVGIGEAIKEFRTRDDELDAGIDDYPSYCDYDKKIHIDCAHNLKFSCMIGFEFTHANVFILLYVNVISKKFHNSIMKDKMVYKGNNVIGALMNVSIFVGTFSVVTDFAVLENMDDYRNEGMGDRFKYLTNEQCNKIPPLLKVSEEDKMNGISHPYQKLKGFYKGVLNLGPDYIRDAKMEEWLTCGHISVHEMEG